MAITWETHDDIDNALISTNGLYEVHTDPVYGYHSLHRAEDTTTSLGESMDLRDITAWAEDHMANPDQWAC